MRKVFLQSRIKNPVRVFYPFEDRTGFTPIYNRQNLGGWVMQDKGFWTVEQGEFCGSPGPLWKRKTPGCFHQWNGKTLYWNWNSLYLKSVIAVLAFVCRKTPQVLPMCMATKFKSVTCHKKN